jgi:flagellar hook-length control protein FliK
MPTAVTDETPHKPLFLITFYGCRQWPDDCRPDCGNPENQTVPPVASDATAPAYQPSLPNPAWAAPSSGRASDSPFDALLDDSTQAAAQPPAPPPPPSNNNPPQVQSDSDQNSAQDSIQSPVQGSFPGSFQVTAQNPVKPAAKPQSKDPVKAADANTDQPSDSAADTAAAFDTLIKDFKTAKANQDAKTEKQTAKLTDKQTVAGDDSKPMANAKQTDAVTAANPTVTTVGNAIQTAVPATLIAPTVLTQNVPAAVLQAAASSIHPAIAGTDTTKIKTADTAAAKTDSAKLSADANASATKASVQIADGKTQTANGDADKLASAPQHDTTQAGKSHTEASAVQAVITPDAQGSAAKMDGGAVQQAALSVPTPDASQTAATPAAPAASTVQAAAIPLAGVAVEIAGKALEGKNHFEIRLDPPELGRIDVRLDVDKDGNTTTHMIADRSDTLNLLRNDSSDLQRALQDAGLKTSDNGLQFSLRDQSMGQQQSNAPTPGTAQIIVNDDTLAASELTPRSYPRLAGMGGGIDIRV